MTKQTRRWTFLVAAITTCCMAAPLSAQVILDGTSAFENLDKGRANASGSMIADGLLRATEAARQGRSQVSAPRITETQPPQSIRGQFLVQAAQTIIQQLNNTILFLATRLLARAGLIPGLSTDVQDFLDSLTNPTDTTNPADTTDSTDTTTPTDTTPPDSNNTGQDGTRRPPRGGRG